MQPSTHRAMMGKPVGRSATSKPRLVNTPVPIMFAITMLVAVKSEMDRMRLEGFACKARLFYVPERRPVKACAREGEPLSRCSGSAASGEFATGRSDVDFLVSFRPVDVPVPGVA